MNRSGKANVRRSQSFDKKKGNKAQQQSGEHGQLPLTGSDRSTEGFTEPQDKMRYNDGVQTLPNGNGRATTPSGDGLSSVKRTSSLRRSFRKLSGSGASAGNKSTSKKRVIEVVPGSFHKVAGISAQENDQSDTVDGPFAGGVIRTVEIKLGANRSERGFDIEHQYRPSVSGRNGLAYVVARVSGSGVVSEQRLLRDGDEVIAVNGLTIDTAHRLEDVEQLLRARDTLQLRVRCVSDSNDARYTPRRSLSPADTPQHTSSAYSHGRPSVSPYKAQEKLADFSRGNDSSSVPTSQLVGKEPEQDLERKQQAECAGGRGSGVVAANGLDRDTAARPDHGRPPKEGPDCREQKSSELDAQSPERPPPPTEFVAQQKQTSRPRPPPPERKSSRSVRRRDSLRSAHKLIGRSDGQPAAATVMLEMAQVFVDEKEKLQPDQRRQLLAECLAEEFNLPFLVEQASTVAFAD